MNTEQLVTPGAISAKMISLFVFIVLEIVCNTMTFFYDMSNNE